MKILITNYHCASNRGDAAIMEGLISSLEDVFQSPEITIATEFPEASSIIHDTRCIKQKTPFRAHEIKKNIARLYSLFGAFVQKYGLNVPKFGKIIERMNLQPHLDSDLVIGTGGHYITDIYFPNKIGILWELYFAKMLGKPVVLVAQSAGPFEDEKYKEITRFVLNQIDIITTRDEQTKENLEKIGVTDTPIHFTADTAFFMDLKKKSSIENNKFENIHINDSDGLSISISAREWPHIDRPEGQRKYVKSLSKVADWLISKKEAEIRFISTCTGFDGYHTDDRIIANRIIENMNNSDRAAILYGEYTPQELVNIYKEMDIHIGTRMHSNILAILGGTPIVPIQYQFKTRGLAKQFDIEEYLISIDEITYESLRENTKKALSNKSKLERDLEAKVLEIKENAKKNGELIHSMYNSTPN